MKSTLQYRPINLRRGESFGRHVKRAAGAVETRPLGSTTVARHGEGQANATSADGKVKRCSGSPPHAHGGHTALAVAPLNIPDAFQASSGDIGTRATSLLAGPGHLCAETWPMELLSPIDETERARLRRHRPSRRAICLRYQRGESWTRQALRLEHCYSLRGRGQADRREEASARYRRRT